MKAKYLNDAEAAPRAIGWPGLFKKDDGKWYFPAGYITDLPDCYRLVQMGVAEPADEECTLRACMTSAEMKAAQRQQDMVGKGIHPDDYQRYLDGEIIGYDEDGNDLPGPNWQEEDDDDGE